MFHRHGKKVKLSHAKPLKDLTRIVPAVTILAEEKRANLLEQIKEKSAFEAVRFDSLCLSLINSLINHCQFLPETSNSYYAQPAGIIDHALNRTEAALELFQQYIVLDNGEAELSEEQKLWQYALFSAAILQGIGKLQVDYNLDLFDGNGHFLKQWNPLLENLASVGSYYDYAFQKESDDAFRCRLNLLMARLLMPGSGFAWLASNQQVLAVWLALLNEDAEAAGTLGAILERANSISIQRYFNQFLLKGYGARGSRFGRVSTFGGSSNESLKEYEQQIGIEFVQWLTKSLASGKIMINKAPLWMVPGGLLMSAEIFKYFVREHPEYKNWQAIQNAFLSLSLHSLAPNGTVISRFQQLTTQAQSGIMFSQYTVALPAQIKVYNASNGTAVTVSAMELIYQVQRNSHFALLQEANPANTNTLLHLNSAGIWKSGASVNKPILSRGIINGA